MRRLLKSWTRKCLIINASSEASSLRRCSSSDEVGLLTMHCGEPGHRLVFGLDEREEEQEGVCG
jgi:hypothetical protein